MTTRTARGPDACGGALAGCLASWGWGVGTGCRDSRCGWGGFGRNFRRLTTRIARGPDACGGAFAGVWPVGGGGWGQAAEAFNSRCKISPSKLWQTFALGDASSSHLLQLAMAGFPWGRSCACPGSHKLLPPPGISSYPVPKKQQISHKPRSHNFCMCTTQGVRADPASWDQLVPCPLKKYSAQTKFS